MAILGVSSAFFIQALGDFVFINGRDPTLNWLKLGMLPVLLARVTFLGLRAYPLSHLTQRVDAENMRGYHHDLLGLPAGFLFDTAHRRNPVASERCCKNPCSGERYEPSGDRRYDRVDRHGLCHGMARLEVGPEVALADAGPCRHCLAPHRTDATRPTHFDGAGRTFLVNRPGFPGDTIT